MKKIIIIGLLFSGLFLLFAKINTSAKIPPSFYLPSGLNYLNPDNVYYTPIDGDYEGTLTTRDRIRVKPGVDYCIYCINSSDVAINSQTIMTFDDETEDLIEIDSDNDGSTIFFTTNEGVDSVFIEFTVINESCNDDIHIWDVGANYVMAEEDTVDTNNLSNYQFAGYRVDGYSILGDSVLINTVISDPISFNTIKNNLVVFDFEDGLLTQNKEVVRNTYGTSDYKVGDWVIEFTVKNSRNISKNIVINIHVSDDVKPVISGPTQFVMKNIAMKTLADVKAELTASDNVDGDLTNGIVIDTENDAFTNRTTELGTFPVNFKVVDSSGNVGNHVVNVVVEQGDFAGPVFSGTFARNLSVSSPMTTEELLADITAIDDYSGDVTNRIEILYNDYKYNTNKAGNYMIRLRVVDNAGNKTTRDILITVYDDSAPTFAFTSTIIYLPLKSNMEDVGDIITMLQRTGYITEDEVVVKQDSYSENKNALGSYIITLEQNNIETSVIVNVEEGIRYLNCIELPKSVEYTIDTSNRPAFLNMIYDVCCRVKAFFKDFFSSIF